MNRSPDGYRTPARLMHWAIAAGVLVMIPAGILMVRAGFPRGLQDPLFLLHKNLGTLLIPLILVRLIYRLRHPAPALPATLPPWQHRVAGASHLLLHVLLVVVPLAGFVRVRAGGFPVELLDRLGAGSWLPRSDALAGLAKTLHFGAGYLLVLLVLLHVGAALQHRLILRDGVWSRMWPPRAR